MHLWFRLAPQAVQTLKLLQDSHINPQISSEAQLNREFDFNKTILAPPGTKVLIHERPAQQKTWSLHGTEDFYVGRAPNHYWCYKVYATKYRSERISQQVPSPPVTEICLPSLPLMPPPEPLLTFALPSVTRTLPCPYIILVTHSYPSFTNSRKSSVQAPRLTPPSKQLQSHL